MTKVAIVDLDGTLFSGRLWRGVVLHHRTQHVNRRWLYLFLAVHVPMWFLHQKGLFSETRARSMWARNMGWVLRGLSHDEMNRVMEWVADNYVIPRTRMDVLDRVRQHREKGDHVILLSGTFEPLAVALTDWVGADVALGMRLEIRDGRCTGRTLPPLPQGRGKLERLQMYLRETGLQCDLNAAHAYADSQSDLPVLEAVGHPVAVYPDPVLARVAQERGWPIIGQVAHDG